MFEEIPDMKGQKVFIEYGKYVQECLGGENSQWRIFHTLQKNAIAVEPKRKNLQDNGCGDISHMYVEYNSPEDRGIVIESKTDISATEFYKRLIGKMDYQPLELSYADRVEGIKIKIIKRMNKTSQAVSEIKNLEGLVFSTAQ